MKTNTFPLLAFVVCLIILSCGENSTDKNTNVSQVKRGDTTIVMEAPTVNTAGSDKNGLFIDDGGSGGLPVIFVHSYGGSTVQWKDQLAHLRESRRAVAFDLRGHGQSPTPVNGDYSMEAFASDIGAVADSLHLQNFVLVGHSQGAAAAIAFAGMHPERLRGLVLESTPIKTPPAISRQVMASLESDKYESVMTAYMKGLLTNSTAYTDSLEKAGMQQLTKEANLRIIRSTLEFDPIPSLKKYSGPVLIISSPAENKPGALHTLFPKDQHIVVEGTSHWIHLDKPGKFNILLDEFLQKIR